MSRDLYAYLNDCDISGPLYEYLGHFRQPQYLEAGHNITFGRAGIVEDLEPGPLEGYTNETGPSRARIDQGMLQANPDDTGDNIEKSALSEKWKSSEVGLQKSERGPSKGQGL